MGLVAAGGIPFCRIGARQLRFPVKGLQDWLAAQQHNAEPSHSGTGDQAGAPAAGSGVQAGNQEKTS
jgi:hypothetical protein